MSIAHLLEDFGTARQKSSVVSLSDVDFEEEKLEAFENGYTAGWDDAVKSQSEDQTKVSSDFARNLQDLSFTYHEAHSHVIKAMNPLLQQIVEAVLPEVAHKTIGLRVVEQLREMARGQAGQTVEIRVAPANVAAMEKLIDQELAFPVGVSEDPALGEGQAYMRFGTSERQIDLDEVLAGIGQAVAGFFHETKKEKKNG